MNHIFVRCCSFYAFVYDPSLLNVNIKTSIVTSYHYVQNLRDFLESVLSVHENLDVRFLTGRCHCSHREAFNINFEGADSSAHCYVRSDVHWPAHSSHFQPSDLFYLSASER